MKKSIFLFFAAILCAIGMEAANLTANYYIYFEKPSDWSNVSFLIGHNTYSIGYNMTKISNTNLYYWKTEAWGGYTQYAFIDAKDWGGQDWGDREPNKRKTYAAHYSSTFYANSTSIAKYHLFNTTKSIKSHASDRKIAINRTQTIKVQLKDGSNWVDATVVPADLTASTYAMTTSSTAVSAASASLAKESTTVSATVDAAYSATVSLSCTNVLDGYVFEGWYDANGNKITSYTVSDAHTVYARFIQSAEETNEVSVTYMCGATEVSPAIAEIVGVETEKSFTAPTVTGYNFTGWTIGAGITLKAGTASDATITVVTKSASSDYTLVANYEEKLETVYFINTNKWARVNIHKWNGNASGSNWPGEQLTASGEKIGEYDVYSYTAKEGDYGKIIFNSKTSNTDSGNDQTADLDWTAGKYYIHKYNGNTGWYTQAEAEALLVAPIVYEKVYFVNNKNWSLVQIHAWKGSDNNGWPGQALTATGEKVAGFDVYSFTAPQGTYTNLLFNNKEGDAGVQSNNFVWTADKYYYMDAAADYAGGTAAEVEAALATPVVEETVYFVNNKNWTKVQVHAWKDAANNGWPGQALTTTGEKVAGFDVYSFTAPQGTYTNLLFNNKEGDAGVQSNNFVWTADKYYYMGAAENYAGGTKEEVAVLVTPDPLATDVYLVGEMNSWSTTANEFKKATAEATTASITVNLTAQTYKFKLIIGEGNWRGNTGTMKRGGNAVHEGGWSFEEEGGDEKNCKIVADIAGDYTFTWDLNTKKLTVTYPALPKHQVTATVNPAETGEVTGTGEYEQGSEATLIATPAAGYAFKNWTVGGTEKSTEATYTFTVNEPISLVANFIPEVTHEVTVSYICNSNPIPSHDAHTLAVGVTTPSTITAPAITNYTFNGWTLGSGVQAVDANANPIQITTKAEGEYTLTANYTKIELTYTVEVPAGTEKCYIRGGFDDWDKFHEMELKDGETNIFTLTIDGAVTTDEYKYACQASWDYKELDKEGNDIANRTWTELDKVEKWAEPAKCYLMGIGGDWTTGIEMTKNPDNSDEYMLLKQPIAANEPIKIKLGDTWCGTPESGSAGTTVDDGNGGTNIALDAGLYDFYYKVNNNEVYIALVGYYRNVTNTFGTICLPYASASTTGATFYRVAGKETGKVYLESVNALEAGVPYIFEKTANQIKVVYTGDKETTAGYANGLHGTFTDDTKVAVGNYILKDNALCQAATTCYVNANRAYLVMSEVPAGAPQQMPGRRYIGMDVQGENEATGVEDLFTTDAPVKVIENGQLIIIRDGVKYNVQGQKL